MSLHQNEEYRSPIFHDFDQSEIVIVKRNNKKGHFPARENRSCD